MRRTFALLLAMVLLSLTGCWAAGNPVVGKWNCTSNDGTEVSGTFKGAKQS
jgi:hypothetical protein